MTTKERVVLRLYARELRRQAHETGRYTPLRVVAATTALRPTQIMQIMHEQAPGVLRLLQHRRDAEAAAYRIERLLERHARREAAGARPEA